jgi:CBS domain-containing protein
MFHDGLSTLVTYNPWSVSFDTDLDELLRMLNQLGFNHWPVIDEHGKLAGILSEIDVLRAVEERHAVAMAPAMHGGRCDTLPNCRAADIMQRRVITVGSHDSPREALDTMLSGGVHSLPVIDDGRLLGIVTSSDFLREFSYGDSALGREPVTSLIQPATEPIDVEATLDEANAAFHQSGADYLPVVQGDFPLGVVSRRSVRKARCRQTARELLAGEQLDGPTSIAGLVTNAPTLVPGMRLSKAAGVLVDAQLQAAAVVNQANRLLGVLTESRLLHAMLEQLK